MKKILSFLIILVLINCGGLEKKWVSKVEFMGSGDYRIYDASNTLLAGSFGKEGDPARGFLAKYSDAGNFMWSGFFKDQGIKSSAAKQVLEVFSHAYVLIEGEDSAGKNVIFVVGYDGYSNMLWNRKIIESAPGKKIYGSLLNDHHGNIYVGGSLINEQDSLVTFLTKLNTDGDMVWVAQYYNPRLSLEDPKFGISTGEQSVIAGLSPDGKNFLYLRYDRLGKLVAMKARGNEESKLSAVVGAAIDRRQTVFILATTNTDSTGTDFLTMAYGSGDSLLWSRSYSSPGNVDDVAEKIMLDDSQNVYVFGTSRDAAGMRIVSVKYDDQGNVSWRRIFQGRGKDISGPFLIRNGCYIVCTAGSDVLIIEYNEHGLLKMNKRCHQGSGKNVPIAFSKDYLVLENEVEDVPEYYIVKFEPSQLGFFRWD